tara:strand:- start:48 stop:368 length:321 start_codon:yes stop_codon:yes gene_type:complete
MTDTNEPVLSDEVIAEILNERGTYFEPIATRLMVELVKQQGEVFLLLKDDQINKWWSEKVTTAKKTLILRKEKLRLYNIRMGVWDRLSASERKLLGLTKPKKPAGA